MLRTECLPRGGGENKLQVHSVENRYGLGVGGCRGIDDNPISMDGTSWIIRLPRATQWRSRRANDYYLPLALTPSSSLFSSPSPSFSPTDGTIEFRFPWLARLKSRENWNTEERRDLPRADIYRHGRFYKRTFPDKTVYSGLFINCVVATFS